MKSDPTDDDALAEAVDWRLRIDEAPHDEALRSALARWLSECEAHRTAYRDVDRVTRLARALPAGAGVPARPGPIRAPVGRRRLFVGAAVALAACLAAVLAPAAWLRLEADHLTATAELRRIVLEDGSAVVLDGSSAIAVRYSAARRQVALLAGQAYFEVVPALDRPFAVAADDLTVTVTGTAFDVDVSSDTTSVAVRSGTVEVASNDGSLEPATLQGGDRLERRRSARSVTRSSVDPADVAAWRERRLTVDNARLGDIVEELGRHYPGVVMMPGRALAERPVSGVFDLRRPFEAMEAVVQTHGGSVVRMTPWLVMIFGP
jgi:transmembrane sensor